MLQTTDIATVSLNSKPMGIHKCFLTLDYHLLSHGHKVFSLNYSFLCDCILQDTVLSLPFICLYHDLCKLFIPRFPYVRLYFFIVSLLSNVPFQYTAIGFRQQYFNIAA